MSWSIKRVILDCSAPAVDTPIWVACMSKGIAITLKVIPIDNVVGYELQQS